MQENRDVKRVLLAAGIAGSGKGFVGELGLDHGWYHISSGEELRGDRGCPLEVLAAGSLKESRRALRLVVAKFLKIGEGNNFVIEGYPRNTFQCRVALRLLRRAGYTFSVVLVFTLPEECKRRIAKDPNREKRNDNGAIDSRHKKDRWRMAQMEKFWRSHGIVVYKVNNNRSKENMCQQFATVLETERLRLAAGV